MEKVISDVVNESLADMMNEDRDMLTRRLWVLARYLSVPNVVEKTVDELNIEVVQKWEQILTDCGDDVPITKVFEAPLLFKYEEQGILYCLDAYEVLKTAYVEKSFLRENVRLYNYLTGNELSKFGYGRLSWQMQMFGALYYSTPPSLRKLVQRINHTLKLDRRLSDNAKKEILFKTTLGFTWVTLTYFYPAAMAIPFATGAVSLKRYLSNIVSDIYKVILNKNNAPTRTAVGRLVKNVAFLPSIQTGRRSDPVHSNTRKKSIATSPITPIEQGNKDSLIPEDITHFLSIDSNNTNNTNTDNTNNINQSAHNESKNTSLLKEKYENQELKSVFEPLKPVSNFLTNFVTAAASPFRPPDKTNSVFSQSTQTTPLENETKKIQDIIPEPSSPDSTTITKTQSCEPRYVYISKRCKPCKYRKRKRTRSKSRKSRSRR